MRPDVEINGYSMYVGPCAFADVQTCAYTVVAASAATLYNIQVSLSLPSKARPSRYVTSDTPNIRPRPNHILFLDLGQSGITLLLRLFVLSKIEQSKSFAASAADSRILR